MHFLLPALRTGFSYDGTGSEVSLATAPIAIRAITHGLIRSYVRFPAQLLRVMTYFQINQSMRG